MGVEEVRHLADQARELKNDSAFQAAILALRKQWHAEQMLTRDREEIVRLAFAMQTLEAIPEQLQVFINDHEAAKKRLR